MRISVVALAGLLLDLSSTNYVDAFAIQTPSLSNNPLLSLPPVSTLRMSAAPPSEDIAKKTTGRSREEIENEVSSGRTLDDGPVVDFGAVKDSTSRAERALSLARDEYLASLSASHDEGVSTLASEGQQRLMGINDDVVREVGREVGDASRFPAQLVQECAALLRSKAPQGTFLSHPSTASDPPASSSALPGPCDELLERSYEESEVVTEAFAKTFYLGTQLLQEESRRAIWAVYVWCRRTDEIVDAPRGPDDVNMLSDLSRWEIRLENLFQHGIIEDGLDLALLDCRIKYPSLSIQPFVDMVRGMLMDIPDLGQERYETFDELHLYCYRVAGTVGLMSMPIFGCAEGYTEELAKEPALSLGVALQITNILRDVGEDATTRGRIYLPRKDMERFGVSEQQILDHVVDSNYVNLMKHEIEIARMYYRRAIKGVSMLSPESRLPVQTSLDCYGKILDKIVENGYDNLTQRAYCTKFEKLAEIPFSWYRTQDISKIFPLPGDALPNEDNDETITSG